jgi:hypothetical protein
MTVHDKTGFGPLNCSADCSPPCSIHWEAIDPKERTKYVFTDGETLQTQTVRKEIVAAYRCVAEGLYGNAEGRKIVTRDIRINIQCKLGLLAFSN